MTIKQSHSSNNKKKKIHPHSILCFIHEYIKLNLVLQALLLKKRVCSLFTSHQIHSMPTIIITVVILDRTFFYSQCSLSPDLEFLINWFMLACLQNEIQIKVWTLTNLAWFYTSFLLKNWLITPTLVLLDTLIHRTIRRCTFSFDHVIFTLTQMI